MSVEIKVAKMEEHLKSLDEGQIRIESKLDKFIDSADVKYAPKESFIFWRKILVSGILVSIFIGVIALMLERFN